MNEDDIREAIRDAVIEQEDFDIHEESFSYEYGSSYETCYDLFIEPSLNEVTVKLPFEQVGFGTIHEFNSFVQNNIKQVTVRGEDISLLAPEVEQSFEINYFDSVLVGENVYIKLRLEV